MKFAIVLSLITAALADRHHNCGCSLRGKYHKLLSEWILRTCSGALLHAFSVTFSP
ncbi:hypothetical protein E4U43_003721 [Claviceps pusilla]|uniref:Uncharacterized protein n=1 Tax=Claviceps pusilla TaxID=123648 RepID=A0A9P7N4C2_9HYPO|nr:hypothetical protein E4U43_003721 [Claviceps pusilla]